MKINVPPLYDKLETTPGQKGLLSQGERETGDSLGCRKLVQKLANSCREFH